MSNPSSSSRPRRSRRTGGRSFAAQILRHDRWFVWLGGLGLGVLLCLGLFVAKIWIVTPPWYKTKIRIRGLDFVQAANWRRTAIAKATAGRLDESFTAWQRAIANNRGDCDLYRGLLHTLVDAQQAHREYLPVAALEGYTLLALGRTNVTDVELLASYLRRFGLYSSEIALLRPHADNLSPAGIRLYSEALFFSDSLTEYAKLWQIHFAVLDIDPATKLIQTAWKCFWGPPGGFSEARQQLSAARTDPTLKLLAAKLQLRVSKAIPDISGYRNALNQLVEAHEDQVADHVALWLLLIDAGQRKEAAELARVFSRPPETAEEAVRLVGALDLLGMGEYALEVISKKMAESHGESQLWIAKAELLKKLKRWKELQELAVAMRSDRRNGKRLIGYAYYLEGEAAQNQGNAEAARLSFERCADEVFPSPVLGLRAGTTLRTLGYAKLAADLLKKNEELFTGKSEYWFELARAAYDSRNGDLLEQAASKVYELSPNNLLAVNNYAAALLGNRSHPDEAIKLTLRVLTEFPDRTDAHLNHALALAMNLRLAEAEAILNQIKLESLSQLEVSVLHFVRFEISARHNQSAEAKVEAALIDRQNLLPAQLKFLDENLKRLEPPPTE